MRKRKKGAPIRESLRQNKAPLHCEHLPVLVERGQNVGSVTAGQLIY